MEGFEHNCHDEQGVNITLFVNGDDTYWGRTFNANHYIYKNNWVGFLAQVSLALKGYTRGTVNSLYETRTGCKVTSFTQLMHGRKYAAATGNEKFKILPQGYRTKAERLMPRCPSVIHYLPCAATPRENPNNTMIFVFNNGQINKYPKKFVFTKQDLNRWRTTLLFVAEHMDMTSVSSLYTINGHEIKGPWQLQNGACYVAVSCLDCFKPLCYMQNFIRKVKNLDAMRIDEPVGDKRKVPLILSTEPKVCRERGGGKCYSQQDFSYSRTTICSSDCDTSSTRCSLPPKATHLSDVTVIQQRPKGQRGFQARVQGRKVISKESATQTLTETIHNQTKPLIKTEPLYQAKPFIPLNTKSSTRPNGNVADMSFDDLMHCVKVGASQNTPFIGFIKEGQIMDITNNSSRLLSCSGGADEPNSYTCRKQQSNSTSSKDRKTNAEKSIDQVVKSEATCKKNSKSSVSSKNTANKSKVDLSGRMSFCNRESEDWPQKTTNKGRADSVTSADSRKPKTVEKNQTHEPPLSLCTKDLKLQQLNENGQSPIKKDKRERVANVKKRKSKNCDKIGRRDASRSSVNSVQLTKDPDLQHQKTTKSNNLGNNNTSTVAPVKKRKSANSVQSPVVYPPLSLCTRDPELQPKENTKNSPVVNADTQTNGKSCFCSDGVKKKTSNKSSEKPACRCLDEIDAINDDEINDRDPLDMAAKALSVVCNCSESESDTILEHLSSLANPPLDLYGNASGLCNMGRILTGRYRGFETKCTQYKNVHHCDSNCSCKEGSISACEKSLEMREENRRSYIRRAGTSRRKRKRKRCNSNLTDDISDEEDEDDDQKHKCHKTCSCYEGLSIPKPNPKQNPKQTTSSHSVQPAQRTSKNLSYTEPRRSSLKKSVTEHPDQAIFKTEYNTYHVEIPENPVHRQKSGADYPSPYNFDYVNLDVSDNYGRYKRKSRSTSRSKQPFTRRSDSESSDSDDSIDRKKKFGQTRSSKFEQYAGHRDHHSYRDRNPVSLGITDSPSPELLPPSCLRKSRSGHRRSGSTHRINNRSSNRMSGSGHSSATSRTQRRYLVQHECDSTCSCDIYSDDNTRELNRNRKSRDIRNDQEIKRRSSAKSRVTICSRVGSNVYIDDEPLDNNICMCKSKVSVPECLYNSDNSSKSLSDPDEKIHQYSQCSRKTDEAYKEFHKLLCPSASPDRSTSIHGKKSSKSHDTEVSTCKTKRTCTNAKPCDSTCSCYKAMHISSTCDICPEQCEQNYLAYLKQGGESLRPSEWKLVKLNGDTKGSKISCNSVTANKELKSTSTKTSKPSSDKDFVENMLRQRGSDAQTKCKKWDIGECIDKIKDENSKDMMLVIVVAGNKKEGEKNCECPGTEDECDVFIIPAKQNPSPKNSKQKLDSEAKDPNKPDCECKSVQLETETDCDPEDKDCECKANKVTKDETIIELESKPKEIDCIRKRLIIKQGSKSEFQCKSENSNNGQKVCDCGPPEDVHSQNVKLNKNTDGISPYCVCPDKNICLGRKSSEIGKIVKKKISGTVQKEPKTKQDTTQVDKDLAAPADEVTAPDLATTDIETASHDENNADIAPEYTDIEQDSDNEPEAIPGQMVKEDEETALESAETSPDDKAVMQDDGEELKPLSDGPSECDCLDQEESAADPDAISEDCICPAPGVCLVSQTSEHKAISEVPSDCVCPDPDKCFVLPENELTPADKHKVEGRDRKRDSRHKDKVDDDCACSIDSNDKNGPRRSQSTSENRHDGKRLSKSRSHDKVRTVPEDCPCPDPTDCEIFPVKTSKRHHRISEENFEGAGKQHSHHTDRKIPDDCPCPDKTYCEIIPVKSPRKQHKNEENTEESEQYSRHQRHRNGENNEGAQQSVKRYSLHTNKEVPDDCPCPDPTDCDIIPVKSQTKHKRNEENIEGAQESVKRYSFQTYIKKVSVDCPCPDPTDCEIVPIKSQNMEEYAKRHSDCSYRTSIEIAVSPKKELKRSHINEEMSEQKTQHDRDRRLPDNCPCPETGDRELSSVIKIIRHSITEDTNQATPSKKTKNKRKRSIENKKDMPDNCPADSDISALKTITDKNIPRRESTAKAPQQKEKKVPDDCPCPTPINCAVTTVKKKKLKLKDRKLGKKKL